MIAVSILILGFVIFIINGLHVTRIVISVSLLMIPANIVANVEREREKAQLRRRRYEAKHPARSHHAPGELQPFIFWDGEGPQDTGYSLFGSSNGDEICHPWLGTTECLNLLLYRATESPGCIHVWYGGNYDVSMILKDLSWRHLNQLKTHNKVVWRGYRIEYVPRKWFAVSNGKVRIKVFDVVSFFAVKFQAALTSFGIGTPEEIEFLTHNKNRRDKFLWQDIEEIKIYWRLELKLGVMLMNQLRQTFLDAGFNVKSWHGPGALARVALKRHKIEEAMSVSPSPVQLAAMYAFAGGRFEMVKGGFINETIYNADLRSAYPHFARDLPNLANGKWRYCNGYAPGKFGIFHIRYNCRNRSKNRIYPLFRRLENGEVIWPSSVEGWYHAPEAELVANDPDATIIEGYVFDEFDETDKPFAWLEEYYRKRQVLKNIGNPAEFTFKLIINSVYGQLAQRTGWNKRTGETPRYHQLEWAGYITSACRARMYQLARNAGTGLVSIDTDGVYSTDILPVCASTDLGGWDVSVYSAGLFWQSGIYCLRDGTDWTKAKSRGIPKGDFTPELLKQHLDTMTPLTLHKHTFYGFGLAINGMYDRLNTWSACTCQADPDNCPERHVFDFGGQGKRYHNRIRCSVYCPGNGVHRFIQRPARPGHSVPHSLPWLQPDSRVKLDHDTLVAFDLNQLDEDDRWVLSYV